MPAKDSSFTFVGFGKDRYGFRCSILEDPQTGQRSITYDMNTWWERSLFLKHLESLGLASDTSESAESITPLPESRANLPH